MTSLLSQSDGSDDALAYMAELHSTCTDVGIMDVVDPRVNASKPPKANGNMPTFQQGMNGPEAKEYLNAMKLDSQPLKRHNPWVTVDRLKTNKS